MRGGGGSGRVGGSGLPAELRLQLLPARGHSSRTIGVARRQVSDLAAILRNLVQLPDVAVGRRDEFPVALPQSPVAFVVEEERVALHRAISFERSYHAAPRQRWDFALRFVRRPG